MLMSDRDPLVSGSDISICIRCTGGFINIYQHLLHPIEREPVIVSQPKQRMEEPQTAVSVSPIGAHQCGVLMDVLG